MGNSFIIYLFFLILIACMLWMIDGLRGDIAKIAKLLNSNFYMDNIVRDIGEINISLAASKNSNFNDYLGEAINKSGSLTRSEISDANYNLGGKLDELNRVVDGKLYAIEDVLAKIYLKDGGISYEQAEQIIALLEGLNKKR